MLLAFYCTLRKGLKCAELATFKKDHPGHAYTLKSPLSLCCGLFQFKSSGAETAQQHLLFFTYTFKTLHASMELLSEEPCRVCQVMCKRSPLIRNGAMLSVKVAASGLVLWYESGQLRDYVIFAAGALATAAWFVAHHFWFLEVCRLFWH